MKAATDAETTSDKDEVKDKSDDAPKEEKKKFNLPKVNIKTPKVISDIRAKSKERKKVEFFFYLLVECFGFIQI